MAQAYTPGPLCSSSSLPIDTGTASRTCNSAPGPVCNYLNTCEPINQSIPNGYATSSLTLGPDGIKLLKEVENIALNPYDDQTQTSITQWVKGATIGYGHLISKEDWGKYKNGISQKEADELFSTDMSAPINAVREAIQVGLQQNQFDALVIFAFNIGVERTGFRGSSVVKMINNPSIKTNYPTLETAWKAWNKSQGKAMKGLDNRRNCEWDIYSKAIYKAW